MNDSIFPSAFALRRPFVRRQALMMNLLWAAATILVWLLLTASANAQCSTPAPGGNPNGNGCPGVASLSAGGANSGAGNPINVMTGNKYQREDDLPALPGVLGLEIVRHYNSAYSAPGHPNGVLGRGWRLSYETELVDRAGKLQVLQADGGRVIFDRDRNSPTGCSTRNPENGNIALGRQNGQPDYTWTWTDGRKLHFNYAGKLDRITAPSGEVVRLLYDDQNVLVRVIDPQGRSLNLVYYDRHTRNQFHGVQFIDTPVGRFAYEYGNAMPKGAGLIDQRQLLANLVRVRLPDHFDPDTKAHALSSRGTTRSTTSRIYHHEDPRSPWLMTGISLETAAADGKPVSTRYATYGYDDTGRAILSTHAGNVEKVTLDNSKAGQTVLTNSLGQKTVYRYAVIAGEYRLLEVRGAGCSLCGETNVRYGYDGAGRLADVTRLADNGEPVAMTRTERDKLGRVARVSKIAYQNGKPGPEQTQVRFEYRGDGFAPTLVARPSVVPGKELITRIDYNDAGQPLRIVESGWTPTFDGKQPTPIERSTSFGYTRINGRSLLIRIDGPLPNGPTNTPRDSDVIIFEYDGLGAEVAGSIDFAGNSGLSSYKDRRGILTRIVAPGQRIFTVLERDSAGRPIRINAPAEVELKYEFDWLGHVVLHRAGSVGEHLSYNEFGQLANVRLASGQFLHYVYSSDGRVSDIVDPQNNRIRITRNTEGQLLSRVLLNPDGSIAQQSYATSLSSDPEVLAKSVQEEPKLFTPQIGSILAEQGLPKALLATGNAESLLNNKEQQPVRFTDGRGIKSEYCFDDFGRLVKVNSADTGVAIFNYDAADHLTSKTSGYGTSEASTVQYRYDVAGRVTMQLTREGMTMITYGKSGRPEKIVFPAGEEHYEYDSNARLVAHTRIIDGHSFTTRYAYDGCGQLSKKTLPDGQVLLYRYRSAMHPKAGLLAGIARQDLFGNTVLLDGLNDADDGFARQSYQLANGVSFVRDLDRNGYVTHIGSPGIWEENQQRDARGQLVRRVPPGGVGVHTSYIYDPLGRLTGVASFSNAASTRGYAYDAGGNLLAQLTGTGLTRYRFSPANNHIVRSDKDGDSTAYFYNVAGSVELAGTTSYQWDSLQRLIKVEREGKPVAEYAYNPFGERIKKVVYTNDLRKVTYFLYDGNELVAEAEPNAGSITVTRQYVWLDDSAGSRPIALLQTPLLPAQTGGTLARAVGALSSVADRATALADIYSIVADHTGAPRALVAEGRRVVWRADVRGFGEITPSPDNRLLLNLRGSNQYFDVETGLHYNTRRYLDPGSGRYLSADPLGALGGENPYAFADNNPVNRADPLGLQAKPTGPVSNWNFQDKLKYVVLRAVDQYPGEVGNALKELVSPAALATTASIFTLWTAAQFTPFGWAADIAVAGIGYVLMGTAIWDLISGLYETASLITNAKCEGDLQHAGDILAKGLGKAVAAATAGSVTAGGSGKVASVLRLIFKDRAAGEKAAAVAKLAEKYFGNFTPGRTRSGAVANKEWSALHPDDYPPWANMSTVFDTWLDPGTKIYMINLKSATGPGGWATSKRYTSLAEARKYLSLLQEFKEAGSNCCVIQEYTVKSPIPVRQGTAGPLTSTKPPHDSYPGGGDQWQFLLDRSLTKDEGWKNFLLEGATIELRP
jgi:RHS repeat-associated protein